MPSTSTVALTAPSAGRSSPPLPFALSRYHLISCLLFLALPAFVGLGAKWNRPNDLPTGSSDAKPVRMKLPDIERRDNSPTDVCVRWSHQSTLVNDTIYIYGGQAKMSAQQDVDTDDTWNNNFIKLDLSQDWDTGSVSPVGLPQPSGPPAVANGYLWTDDSSIWLYGGEFSDSSNPTQSATAMSTWKYSIASGEWTDVTKDTAVSSDSGTSSINRAAEGAGATIKARGIGYYFGGHMDHYTTNDWSLQTERVYLKSLLEFDMANQTYTNRTGGGLQSAGVPQRADGILVFVPWGPAGILLAIGGGTNSTFTQLNEIDVYDVQTTQWTKQSTAGSTPQYRVNPCAVVASAPDATSHQVYFFGGQNLQPAGHQTEYDDMWILTVPSFTWIQVNQTGQNVPYARSGHTCELAGKQMIVIGGYVGDELSCDSPGIYVFDASALEWKTSYSAALAASPDGPAASASASNSAAASHAAATITPGGTYLVPQPVIDVVGGGSSGGATVTRPAQSADGDSPLATGAPDQYEFTTITAAAAHATTRTSTDAAGHVVTSVTTPPTMAPVLALFLLALAYWVYRRKLRELRASAAALAEKNGYNEQMAAARKSGSDSSARGRPGLQRSESTTDLMLQGEPSFWGVLLSPRRSLRVVNH